MVPVLIKWAVVLDRKCQRPSIGCDEKCNCRVNLGAGFGLDSSGRVRAKEFYLVRFSVQPFSSE